MGGNSDLSRALTCLVLLVGGSALGCGGGSSTPSEADAGIDAAARDAGSIDAALPVCPDEDDDNHIAIGSCGGDDCDDHDANRHPGALEVCDGLGLDEDCDPTTFGVRDGDGDMHQSSECFNVGPDGTRHQGDDCNDANTSAHPGANETCNMIDDDCDAAIDEGMQGLFYADCDGDGSGDAMDTGMSGCVVTDFPPCQGHRRVMDRSDCNDMRADVNPGVPEVCDAAPQDDENCNGLTNEGCTCADGETVPCGAMVSGCPRGTQTCVAGHLTSCSVSTTPMSCYTDADRDGFAPSGAVATMACGCPDRTTPTAPTGANVDCDDNRATRHPGLSETCDGLDNDCHGNPDDGVGMTCVFGTVTPESQCGRSCTRSCLAGSCTQSCCVLGSTSMGNWRGNDPNFLHGGTFGCGGAPNQLGTDWWWWTGSGRPCDLWYGPGSPISVPAGTYTVTAWLAGDFAGQLIIRNGPAQAGVQVFNLAQAGAGWRDNAGFKLVTATFTITSGCGAITIDLRMEDMGTTPTAAAVAAVTFDRSDAAICP
ncbi:MAG: putative metal-binding motif-containing protein [Sandaracinus sp.]